MIKIWKYKLESGSQLRKAIDDENIIEILTLITKCVADLQAKLLVENELEDYELEIKQITDELELINIPTAEEDEYIRETIDDMLSGLYEVCDTCRCFIEL